MYFWILKKINPNGGVEIGVEILKGFSISQKRKAIEV